MITVAHPEQSSGELKRPQYSPIIEKMGVGWSRMLRYKSLVIFSF